MRAGSSSPKDIRLSVFLCVTAGQESCCARGLNLKRLTAGYVRSVLVDSIENVLLLDTILLCLRAQCLLSKFTFITAAG